MASNTLDVAMFQDKGPCMHFANSRILIMNVDRRASNQIEGFFN